MNIKIDSASLHQFSVELKELIKTFISSRDGQKDLIKFLNNFTDEEANLLLQQFDRYGENLEYEKSGLRFVKDNGAPAIICKKYGYRTEEDALKDCERNTPIFKIRQMNIGKEKLSRPWASSITFPPTKKLMEVFKIILGKSIFNTSIDDMTIYNRVKKLKTIVESVSENGFTEKNVLNLQDIFNGESSRFIDSILKLFDTEEKDVKFLGIRAIKYDNQLSFISIGKNFRQCEFRYNILNLRKTVDIIQRWKEIKELESKSIG